MAEREALPSTRPRADREEIEARLVLAFAPLHKRAFGVAVGLAAGGGVLALTVFHLVVQPQNAIELSLLAQYFYGYTVSWQGAFVGAFWGFFSGFVTGWFLAFSRNALLAIWIFLGRAKSELTATRDFLDHI